MTEKWWDLKIILMSWLTRVNDKLPMPSHFSERKEQFPLKQQHANINNRRIKKNWQSLPFSLPWKSHSSKVRSGHQNAHGFLCLFYKCRAKSLNKAKMRVPALKWDARWDRGEWRSTGLSTNKTWTCIT